VRHLIEFFPMTEDKHQEVLDALNAAMQGKACPMCGGQERTLIDRFGRQDVNEIGAPFHNSLRKIVATTLTQGLTHPEAGYLPFAILVCEKCGLMTYHHLGRLKIAY
jgi:hypothetical protein